MLCVGADFRRLVRGECLNDLRFRRIRIDSVAEDARSVYATDVDNDGDVDVLLASSDDDTIAWHENDGKSPPGFEKHEIFTEAEGATSVYAADLDNDGDIDVLSASYIDGLIAWHESDGGSPPTFTYHGIVKYSLALGSGSISLYAADLDDDGDVDFLSASFSDSVIVTDDGTIAWFENNGGSAPTFTRRVIWSDAMGAESVYAADLDNDGDLDVLSASSEDNTIAWYENDYGLPPTFSRHVISEVIYGANSVFAVDLDDDGDIDVLSTSYLNDTIAWHENDGESPPNFKMRLISTKSEGAASVYATDLDNDGDIDVLSASSGDDAIAWYENDGGSPPRFEMHIISKSADVARSVYAADVDGDGDVDVLSASSGDNAINWYQNDCAMTTPNSTKPPTVKSTTQPTPEPTETQPTIQPISKPTAQPTPKPSLSPTALPTPDPPKPIGNQPTLQPTQTPEPSQVQPTLRPMPRPTAQPIQQPIASPTFELSEPERVISSKKKKNGSDFVTELVIAIICAIVSSILGAMIAAYCDSCRPEFDRRLPYWFHYYALGYWINCCSCENCCYFNGNTYITEHPLHGGSLAAFGVESVTEVHFVTVVLENPALINQLRHHGLNIDDNGGDLALTLRNMFAAIVGQAQPPCFNQAQWRNWLRQTYRQTATGQPYENGGHVQRAQTQVRDDTEVMAYDPADIDATLLQTSVVDAADTVFDRMNIDEDGQARVIEVNKA